MNVSVAEVLAGAAAHAVPLTAECVGYLVLGAADQVLGAPRCLGAGDLVLSEDGAVRVAGGRAAQGEDAERDLRALLDALLLRASGASPGLLRASRRPAGSGLQGLVRELETALIPVNRAAAKRALSRLQRETRRALDSGRIRLEESEPEAAPLPTRAPVVESPAPSVEVEPPAVVSAPVIVASPPVIVASPPVIVASPPVIVASAAPVAELAAPVVELAAPVVEESSSEPLPSVALPPVLPAVPSDPVQEPWPAERRDLTLVLAEVAPREPTLPEPPHLVETRPEPVVRRASQRPAATAVAEVEPILVDPGHTVPLPPVSIPEPAVAASPPSDTPVLGTRVVAEADVPSMDAPGADAPSADAAGAGAEANTVVAASEAAVVPDVESAETASEEDDLEIVVVEEPAAAEMRAEDDDGLIEVIFEEDERTVFPEDHELLFAAPDEREAGEATDPCPPLAAESMLPPPCEVVTAAPPPSVAPMAEALSELPPVAPKGEPLPQALDPREVELALLVESALPPWTREEAPAFEVTPPPRVALPEPRRSDVAELLLRLGQAPLGVDELRSGLKRLAGLELTPPPPGTAPGE